MNINKINSAINILCKFAEEDPKTMKDLIVATPIENNPSIQIDKDKLIEVLETNGIDEDTITSILQALIPVENLTRDSSLDELEESE